MLQYILIGLGFILFGVPFIIQVITWIVKPTVITEEEKALRKREYEKAKKRGGVPMAKFNYFITGPFIGNF